MLIVAYAMEEFMLELIKLCSTLIFILQKKLDKNGIVIVQIMYRTLKKLPSMQLKMFMASN